MISTDLMYVVDYVRSSVLETINIEYLDISTKSLFDAVDPARFTYLQHLKQHYKTSLASYCLDSSTNIMISIFKRMKCSYPDSISYVSPYEEEMLYSNKHVWGCYSRGDFFSAISDTVRKSPTKKLAILKSLNGIKKMKFILCEPSTADCMACFIQFVCTIISFTTKTNEISQTECDHLVAYTLEVFSCSEFMRTNILQLQPQLFRFVINSARLRKFNFCGIWQETNDSSHPLFWTLNSDSLPNFLTLLKVGARNVSSSEVFDLLLMELRETIKFTWCDGMEYAIDLLEEENRLNFLILQVLILYVQCKKNSVSLLPTKALKALWKSIPDPYLTEWNFMILNGGCYHSINFFKYCWQWYYNCLNSFESDISNETTLRKPIGGRTPRSLTHLSTCAIKSYYTSKFCMTSHLMWGSDIPSDLKSNFEI